MPSTPHCEHALNATSAAAKPADVGEEREDLGHGHGVVPVGVAKVGEELLAKITAEGALEQRDGAPVYRSSTLHATGLRERVLVVLVTTTEPFRDSPAVLGGPPRHRRVGDHGGVQLRVLVEIVQLHLASIDAPAERADVHEGVVVLVVVALGLDGDRLVARRGGEH
ncbi:hypothetical protein T492DRAFT_936022, partial [Pavlovales sp. CCMP2436]